MNAFGFGGEVNLEFHIGFTMRDACPREVSLGISVIDVATVLILLE